MVNLSAAAIKCDGLYQLNEYWPSDCDALVADLPIPSDIPDSICLPVELVLVDLPSWAKKFGCNGQIAVPAEASLSLEWQDINWWYVIHWYLHCLAEREFEANNTCTHSYSYRLTGWNPLMWQYAWVNRIALFLREWVAQREGKPCEDIFGPRPEATFYLTHDLDAVDKTIAIRLKQTAFNCFKFFRSLVKGQFHNAAIALKTAAKFMFTSTDYNGLSTILTSIKPDEPFNRILFIYSKNPHAKRNIRHLLLDPAYDIKSTNVIPNIRSLKLSKCNLGLHQSFDAWKDSVSMFNQKRYLEDCLDSKVSSCRQHWLRFSFKQTWEAQAKAGFEHDFTLGFNDRIGFRNGSALTFKPLSDYPYFSSTPMVLMDSHLYDYNQLPSELIAQTIDQLLEEIRFVGGKVSFIWHPHTLNSDYGWLDGYKILLAKLAKH